MLLKREKPIFLNIHEFVFTPGALEALLLSAETTQEYLTDEEEEAPVCENATEENREV